MQGLPPDTTLEDLLATILLKTAYDWEALPLPGFPLQDFSTDGGDGHLHGVLHAQRRAGPGRRRDRRAHSAAGARTCRTRRSSRADRARRRRADADVARERAHLARHGIELDTRYELTFQAKPGLSLGPSRRRAKIDADRPRRNRQRARPGRARAITEPGEPANGEPEPRSRRSSPTRSTSATRRAARTATTSRCQADPGEQLTIHLSHLNVDDDLVVFGPSIAPLRTPHPGAEAPRG